jgi:hypothetical protein
MMRIHKALCCTITSQRCEDVLPPLLFIEGDILNCIIKFPRYALLHIEAALLLVG